MISISQPLPPTNSDPEKPNTDSMVRGFMSFPTDPPEEDILAGNAWLRVGDVHFFNSSAGAGKSVALIQASMAWGLGLPFLSIKPFASG
jgi:hypothetical protein